MKYTTEEALREIQIRGNKIRRRHERKVTRILSVSTALSFVALFIVISAFSGTLVSKEETSYGSFILSKEAGGFVLAAVLGFIIGVVFTFVVRHFKEKKT
ncbi:MAG: hypothetical protein IJL60_08535 [Clostridiales bacterium]|nr:hypothetical protein [Clostridiales bacterium]MBQ6270726.1 hypothetical protein [Clostridiales bacterium]MBR4009911.1 hypothetical protein [Clostridiales bacterium]